jgi:hypothetical protein
MKIKEFITEDEYNYLVSVQKERPLLTYKAKDYETSDYSKFSQEDNDAFNTVFEILKKTISDVKVFKNFSLDRNGNVRLRFEYIWTDSWPSFTGAGYITPEEMRDGIKIKEECKTEE